MALSNLDRIDAQCPHQDTLIGYASQPVYQLLQATAFRLPPIGETMSGCIVGTQNMVATAIMLMLLISS